MSNLPDQLQPRALCTLIDVCKRLPGYEPGSDGEIDDILNDLIVQESRDFIDETKREITSRGDEDARLFDLDYQSYYLRELWIGDNATVTAVELLEQDGTLIQELDETAWTLLPRNREDWQPVHALAFPTRVPAPATLRCSQVVSITGTWGFPAIPDTVRRAVATFVIFRYLNDVAVSGTRFAEFANTEEFNMSGSLRVALDVRSRLRIPTIG